MSDTPTLNDVALINPETLSSSTPGDMQFRYIDLGSVSKGTINWSNVVNTTFAAAPSRARRITRADDALFGTVRPALESHASIPADAHDREFVASTGFAVIRSKRGAAHSRFLHHYLFSQTVRDEARRAEVGSNYPAVNESDIRRFAFPPISYAEQGRIAEILDAVDDQVRATEQIIAKLRLAMQGQLDDLLRYGIDENGRVRKSSDLAWKSIDSTLEEIPPQWQVANLRKGAEIKHGFAFDGKFFTDSPEHPVLLTPGNFHRDGGLDFSKRNVTYFSGEIPDSFVLNRGDLLVVMTDLSPRTLILGRAVILSEDFPVLHNQRIGKVLIRPSSRLDPEYLCLLMNSYRFRSRIVREATGTTVRHTSPQRILSADVAIPPVPEQKQIVRVAHGYEQRIRVELGVAEKLRALRSGLMTDLLTGRVHVPGETAS